MRLTRAILESSDFSALNCIMCIDCAAWARGAVYLSVFKHEAQLQLTDELTYVTDLEVPRAIFDLKDLTDIKSPVSRYGRGQTRNVGPDIAGKHRKLAESRAEAAKRPPGPSGLNPNGRSLRGQSYANMADVSIGPNPCQDLSNVAWCLALMSFSSWFSIQCIVVAHFSLWLEPPLVKFSPRSLTHHLLDPLTPDELTSTHGDSGLISPSTKPVTPCESNTRGLP